QTSQSSQSGTTGAIQTSQSSQSGTTEAVQTSQAESSQGTLEGNTPSAAVVHSVPAGPDTGQEGPQSPGPSAADTIVPARTE
ncbi:MAG: hypothetical protein Q4E86_13775, partial [Lachnospiraceae bacterium]|nr:hypothetical protein [Lachnospiraceae bacterium]